jgi:phenylacetate-CoA ligase
VGETVSDELRARIKTVLGIVVEDVYSSQEVGSIAHTCYYGTYHTMDQNLIVEILDADNQPVAVGETGRVVITDLHNYASPVIRYDIGDYAVRGAECQCGRGLNTLQKIQGRERNLICHPDGSRHWPQVGMYQFDTLDFLVRRYQVVQHSLTDIEYRIVVDEPISPSQESALIALARAAMGDHFTYRVSQQTQDFAVNPNGKFEEFVCKI